MVVSLKTQFLAKQIFRQNTWSYDRRNTSPFKVEACIIANTKIDQGVLKRNIYSANLLERNKLISGGKYQQRTTKKIDIDRGSYSYTFHFIKQADNILILEKRSRILIFSIYIILIILYTFVHSLYYVLSLQKIHHAIYLWWKRKPRNLS